MGTRYLTVHVNGRSRGVLDTLGGRTLRIMQPPTDGTGVIEAVIQESQRRVFLHAQIEGEQLTIKDVFASPLEAIVYCVGDALSAAALALLSEREREAALVSAQAAERRGEPGLVGILSWARTEFGGRDLRDVLAERAQESRVEPSLWVGPSSGTVH